MTKRRKRTGVNNRPSRSPLRKRIKKISQAVAAQKAASATQKAKAEQDLKDAISKGLRAISPSEVAAVNADKKLAKKVNEEAAVQAAAAYGINIRKPNGKISARLARKAAEAAAVQSASELGVDIRNQRGGISRRKALEAARLAQDARDGKDVDPSVKAAVERQDAQLASLVRDAQKQGYSMAQLGAEKISNDPDLARRVSEEAIILEAARQGIDIRKPNGDIDPARAREVRDISAIRSARELGIDITNAKGGINKRKALEVARLADAIRAGKVTDPQLVDAVARQDAHMLAALRAAERKGEDPAKTVARGNRRDAFDDAEIAAFIRGQLNDRINRI